MKGRNIFRFWIIFLLFLAVFGCKKPQEINYTLFFTNDLQAHLEPDRKNRGGLARIAYLVKQEKEKTPGRVLLLDAGDHSVGTVFGTETRGEAVYRVMNKVGYDVAVYGNHEFDLGAEQAKRYQALAKFPLLACNLRNEQGKNFAPEYALFSLEKLQLAVIGITNPKTSTLVDPSAISGLNFLPPETEVRRLLSQLAGKADLVILLSHQGLKQDISLAYHLPGISMIIGGHSEKKLATPIPVNNVQIMQAGHFGHWLGRIDFSYEPSTKTLKNFQYTLIGITKKIPEDEEVKKAIEEERRNLPPGTNRIIGKSNRTLSQSYLGFWSAELLKAYAQADFGIINTGGVRAKIYSGDITPEDIYEVMPFNDRICVFQLKGVDLLRLKSLRYFYLSYGPRLSPDKIYKVASLDYLLKINDFPGATEPQIFDQLLRNAMIERVEKDQGFKRFWEDNLTPY